MNSSPREFKFTAGIVGGKKMNSSSEEFKVPLLPNSRSLEVRIRGFCDVFFMSVFIAVPIWMVFVLTVDQMSLTSDKPEIRLDSLFVCSTNTSTNLLIWDLKFDITNPNNYSDLCTSFELSIFSYNQTKLLTKPADIDEICVGPNNHTSFKAYADAYIQDPNDLYRTNGTIRFDLKIHGAFEFGLLTATDDRRGDLVCRDAKVALSPSSNKSSCGSLVGDAFACSYQRYYKKKSIWVSVWDFLKSIWVSFWDFLLS